MEYLTPEEIKSQSNAIRQKFNRGRDLALKGRNVRIFIAAVQDRKSRVLDCGTGSGAFPVALASEGYQNLIACDIDDYRREGAKAATPGFQKLDMSFAPLPWAEGSFDAVTAWEVLEHLENPHNLIREIHRVLVPEGVFIFSVPNIFHIVSRLVFLRRGLFPRWSATNNHISLFPRGILEKAVFKYFTLEHEGYVGGGVNLPFLKHFHFSENEWFGTWVYYVLRKKEQAAAILGSAAGED